MNNRCFSADFASGAGLFAGELAGLDGVSVAARSFALTLPGGGMIVAAALALFAFTTLIGFAYYAEQALGFLAGPKTAKPFRVVWAVLIFVGAVQEVDVVWRLGDVAFAIMALPNLAAVVLLSRRVRERD